MLEFEWYSEKERLIAEKHGLDMEAVKRIFDDPFRIEQYDTGPQRVRRPVANPGDGRRGFVCGIYGT